MDPSTLLLIITIGASILAFQDRELMFKLILSPFRVVHNKEWYRVITHAFVHADWMHLLFNMIALWSFGKAILQVFSTFEFLILYFGGIIFSTIQDISRHGNDKNYLSLGASGAVSAVIFAYILYSPWSLIYLFFIPIPGILFGAIFLWYSVYMNKRGGGNINHSAHFYGAVFGVLFPIVLHPAIITHFFRQLINPVFG